MISPTKRPTLDAHHPGGQQLSPVPWPSTANPLQFRQQCLQPTRYIRRFRHGKRRFRGAAQTARALAARFTARRGVCGLILRRKQFNRSRSDRCRVLASFLRSAARSFAWHTRAQQLSAKGFRWRPTQAPGASPWSFRSTFLKMVPQTGARRRESGSIERTPSTGTSSTFGHLSATGHWRWLSTMACSIERGAPLKRHVLERSRRTTRPAGLLPSTNAARHAGTRGAKASASRHGRAPSLDSAADEWQTLGARSWHRRGYGDSPAWTTR